MSRTPATRALPAVAALAAAALLAACGSSGSAAPPESTAPGTPTQTAITVTDQRGTTLTFDGPVERIVTIPMPAASLVVAVDGGIEHLVGMHPSSASAIADGILGELFPEASSIAADVSGADFVPNVESILALDPDVVIQWGDREESFTAPLEEAGIPVVGLTYGTQDDLEEWVRIFGVLLGQEDRADAILDGYREGATEVEQAVADAADEPGILYLNQSSSEYKAAGSGTYNDYYIQLVGGRNVAAELTGLQATGIEQILAWDPEIILLGNFDTTMPADLYADPLLQDVAAVRDRRVYRVPLGGYRWDPPSQESALMWRWLAQVAHPDLTLEPIRPRIAQTYEDLYGASPTEEQMDRILQLDANAGSADYGAFAD